MSYTDLRYISSIAADLRFVYFGTTQGVAVYDRIKQRWTDPITGGDGLPEDRVDLVGIDAYTNRLLVCSGANIHSLDRADESWRSYSVSEALSPFTSIGIDPNYIWAEGPDAKIRFDKITGNWHTVSSFEAGIEWFGERGGVDIRKPEYTFLAPFYVLGNNLERYDYTAAVRQEKTLWVGSWGFGAFEYDLINRSSSHLLMGIAGGRTDAVCLDGETFWFAGGGFEALGITSWQRDEDVWRYFSREYEFGLLSNRVATIAADSEFIWLGTEDGLSRLDKKKGTFTTFTVFDGLPASEVTALCTAGDSLWVGTGLGSCVMEKESGSLSRFQELGVWVNDLMVLNDTLWAATEDGVFVLDIDSGKWSEFSDPEGVLAVSATCLLADEEKIWFGTWRGVLRFDRRSRSWERFTSPIHLPHERVHALAADRENVWIGTASGVAQFVRNTGDWIRYVQDDGLVGREVNAIISAEGYVYFATEKGVTRYYWSNPFIVR